MDGLSEVLEVGARLGLKFVVRVQFPDGAPTPGHIAKLNEAMAKASAKPRFQEEGKIL